MEGVPERRERPSIPRLIFDYPGGDRITVVRQGESFMVTAREGSMGSIPDFTTLPEGLKKHIRDAFEKLH